MATTKLTLTKGDTAYIMSVARDNNVSRQHLAYMLATAYHETATSMKPVREYGGEKYLRTKKYYPYVGMGYPQLTWRYNFVKAGDKLGVNLVDNPTWMLRKEYAAPVMVLGMLEGWFTGKKLSDYKDGDFFNMRAIINGDKNKIGKYNPVDPATGKQMSNGRMIAMYAREYERLLAEAGYGDASQPVVTKPVNPVVLPAPIVVDNPGVPSDNALSAWTRFKLWLASILSSIGV